MYYCIIIIVSVLPAINADRPVHDNEVALLYFTGIYNNNIH